VVERRPVERHELRLQRSDLIDERRDQLPLGAFADVRRASASERAARVRAPVLRLVLPN
jgi:hypothetical protein